MNLNEMKRAVQHEIDAISTVLISTSDWMAQNPEIGLQEYQASARLCELLGASGAMVERGIAGLPTAFAATLPGSGAEPRVAIIAEYDALPEVGHGCGHNLIATAAVGAGIALARLGQALPGSAIILGTPAEESTVPNAGGKIPIMKHGYFDGIDAAIMIHPLSEDRIASETTLVAHGLDFRFYGKTAHAAMNPHEGVNALDALISMFNTIGLLRQQIRPDARIHGVITHGGVAPNIIPDYAACRFRVRATTPAYAEELVKRIVACAEGGAVASGARMEWEEYIPAYLNMLPNQRIGAVLQANLEALGRSLLQHPVPMSSGSTDFGNVSHCVPSAFAYLAICGPEAGWHSREVAAATQTARGHAAILDGAKSLAMTTLDLLADPTLCAEAHQEHQMIKP